MRRRLAAAALALAASAMTSEVRAQQTAPRDIWPQAAAAARDGDLETANKRTQDLLSTGRTYGIKTYPQYAASAAGLASSVEKETPDVATWATKAAGQLDGNSPAVAFSEADRAARRQDWAKAIPLALQG